MTLTLFPVRLLFAAFMMLLAWPFAFVATVGRSEDAVEPLSWWRWLVDLALKAIMRAMWFSGGFHWVRVKGRPALPSEAPILTMAPHSSYFDAIPVTMTMASIVMKAESKDIPVWGSAFIPGVPVQPVLLRYPNEMYLPTYTPSEEEKEDPALFASNVRRIMAKALGLPIIDYSFEDCQLAMDKGPLRLPRHTCLLEFARLVPRGEETVCSPAAVSPSTGPNSPCCRARAAGTEYKLLATQTTPKAERCYLGSPSEELGTGLKTRVTDEVLHEEASRAHKLCGSRLNLEGFAQYLNQSMTEAVQDIYSLFEEHGKMDVREYVIALSVVCRPFRYLETIKLAFRMFEAQEDGAVVEDELAVILKTALGVGDFAVCDLFRAIDCQDKGKITFDDFCRFMEKCPDFVEQYHCLREPIPQHSRESTSPSESRPSTNGFCADFSPRDPNTHSAAHSKKQD
ncbi:Lysophosphatidylcholine acyltransferase 1 [Anabarilius grahami]|uniref:Lysophosphatidylcholine acyltransferase 1 n=1 Tax=Anabarilius grahami TaxID=495550 RepID=A0A3N0XZ33_ANAGA|nr:Lysophosphatidylcholine acyltransferase 1 [Anabarilius grahami]